MCKSTVRRLECGKRKEEKSPGPVTSEIYSSGPIPPPVASDGRGVLLRNCFFYGFTFIFLWHDLDGFTALATAVK